MGPLWVHSGGTLNSGDDWYDRNMRLELMVVEWVFEGGGSMGGTLSEADKVAPMLMAYIQLRSIFVQSTQLSSLGYCLTCTNLLAIHE